LPQRAALRDDSRAMSPKRDEPARGEVLSSLPTTRPQRRSARRRGAGPAGETPRQAAPAPPDASKDKTAPRASPKRSSGKRQGSKAATAPKRRDKPAPRGRPASVRPSAATRRARPAARPPEADARPDTAPEGVALVGTALAAAGEVAQLGLTVGVQALRGALSRLPRP
jgi:hypothetical protein